MEINLGDLLEEIDKAGKITVGELQKKGFDRVKIELVGKDYGMIRLAEYPDREITNPLNANDYLTVSPKGFEYLNPIKIKKAIEQLDVSIKNFNDSSNKAYNQLNDSINKFNASSDNTALAIIALTIVLVVLAYIPVLNTPQWFIGGVVAILGLIIVVSILKKK